MSNGGVMLSGWLRKSPPERKLRKNAWKKRWFVLRSGRLSGDPNVLEYFRHQGSKKPIRAISLDECSQIDANVPVKYERKDPSHQFVFDIVTKSRTYYLVAESSLEMTSWVRYLCDLCGFTHDNNENQQDLGSQQQTFKAVQPIRSPGLSQNGAAALLQNEEPEPVGGEVPLPLPRPPNTITHRSTIIRRRVDSNGNIYTGEKSPTEVNSASMSSAGSGDVSIAGTPKQARKYETKEQNGYSYAVEPASQGSASDYLLLTDCNTVDTTDKEDTALLNPKFTERRTSTDSVFTHDGALTDSGNDVVPDQPLQSPHLRFVSNMRKHRLDSMPDCPPPLPPSGNNRPIINTTDERGYSFPPDDEDEVKDARKRSNMSSHSHGLSPIDDDLNRVPLNLQREFLVDDMGNPLQGHMVRYPGYSRNQPTVSSGTEYINTTTAASEAGFGNFPPPRYDYPIQQYPVPGRPFMSPTNRNEFPQGFMTSPTLLNGSQRINYDPNQFSPMSSAYSSPKHQHPMYGSPLSKSSIHSSASTLSPHHHRGSPQRMHDPRASPAGGFPKIRRSSSVGQLELVANELAAQTDRPTPTHTRRCSIDNRRNFYTSQPFYQPPPLGVFNEGPKSNPPPRPPKSDAAVKQSRNPGVQESPVFVRRESNVSVQASNLSKSSYSTSRTQSSDGSDPGVKPHTDPDAPPVSPPHTTIQATPHSPVHSEVVGTIDLDMDPSVSPMHSAIIKTIPIQPTHTDAKVNGDCDVTHRSVSSSSTGSGTTSGSSRSRSPTTDHVTHRAYDITKTDGVTPQPDTSLYDVPGPRKNTEEPRKDALYDTPHPQGQTNDTTPPKNPLYDVPVHHNALYDVPVSKGHVQDKLYDTPNKTPDANNNAPHALAPIDDKLSYEPMMSQTTPMYDNQSSYTCMAGATTLINSSPFPTLNKASRSNASEPPPVKRDLKPGRRSLGSDSGNSEGSRTLHSRSSYEDTFNTPESSHRISEAVFTQTCQSTDVPVSPPHTIVMHSLPNTPVIGSRLQPPERPPKHPSQSSLSPRTPPSNIPGRAYPSYGMDRTQTHSIDNQIHRSPSLTHQGPRRSNPALVPGRPPKPYNMTMQTPPPTATWDDGYKQRQYPQAGRGRKTNAMMTSEFTMMSHFPKTGTVPPPPTADPPQITYVELKNFPTTGGNASNFTTDQPSGVGERSAKTEEVVEYFKLDKEKTQALERTKLALEQEQKRGSIDVRKPGK
ncbi:uncharacterized protein LOC100175067 [Ciona intestinalis]